MAYNKAKHLDAAQKHLNQGKIPQAVEEYKTVLKHEPKDQITLMTIGDLFVRQGETFQALEYFERLAQVFLAEGFVTKAIAIYKKIAKLAPEQTRPIERLAELYIQQGILSEARPIYLHLAEQHQRAGRTPQAAALLRKLLEAEPDSPRVQTRLAELCVAMGQTAEAAEAYRNAAEHLHRRGEHSEAIQYADRALQTDPNDSASSVLKVRALIGIGQRAQAIALLRSLPQIGAGGEAADLLLDLYLEDGEHQAASAVAEKIFAGHPKRFAAAHRAAAAFLEARDSERALALLDRVREAMTDAGEHEALSKSLQQAAEQLPGRAEPREWLVQLYQRASDSFRLPDALAELAAVLEASGQLQRARQVYEQIIERDPENEAARRTYESILSRLGPEAAAAPASPAPAEPAVPAPQAGPSGEPPLDEPTQQFITQSLTDVDLFSSYGLTQKAIDLLEVVLERAPRHVPSIERLLDFHLGAGNERRTAELASQLQQILTERGEFAAAERFEQLHRRFGRAAALSSAEAEAPAPAASQEAPAPAEVEAAPAPVTEPLAIPEPAPLAEPVPVPAEVVARQDVDAETTVHEVDLSEEWAALSGELKNAATSFLSDTAEDVPLPAEPTSAPAQDSVAHAEAPTLEQAAAPETETVEPLDTSAPAAASIPAARSIEDVTDDLPVYTLDFDATDGTTFGIADAPEDALPEHAPKDAKVAAPSGNGFVDALAAELNAALPPIEIPEEPQQAAPLSSAPPPPLAPPPLAPNEPPQATPVSRAEPREAPQDASPPKGASAPGGPLSDLFDEFRAELDALAEDEDPETHYNLGVAYREMGLLEEAISEFQKVAKAGNGKHSFRYAMQCCTLLGLSFMEKNQPLIAAMWYERALDIPGLDHETILALRYDLGVAQELAGETAAARKSFSQVYGMNIDYRDVAERLAGLGKGS